MTTASRATPDTPLRCGGAYFDACPIGPTMMLQTVFGEIDAANSTCVSEYVEAHLGAADRLILDLRGLTFFGTHGFSALHRVNVICSRNGVALAVVAGAEVDRILRICDPAGGLPVTHSLASAITAAAAPPRNHLGHHLRLVSGD